MITITKTTTCKLGAGREALICSRLRHTEQKSQTLSACTTWSTPCPETSWIAHNCRQSQDLDKGEAVDEVPEVTEKRRLGASFHLSPLESLQKKNSTKSLDSRQRRGEQTWRQSQQPHSSRIWGSGFRKEIWTWRHNSVKVEENVFFVTLLYHTHLSTDTR